MAGVGLFERVSKLSSIRRNAQATCHKIRNRETNMIYWGHAAGDSTIMRAVGTILPFNYISMR